MEQWIQMHVGGTMTSNPRRLGIREILSRPVRSRINLRRRIPIARCASRHEPPRPVTGIPWTSVRACWLTLPLARRDRSRPVPVADRGRSTHSVTPSRTSTPTTVVQHDSNRFPRNAGKRGPDTFEAGGSRGPRSSHVPHPTSHSRHRPPRPRSRIPRPYNSHHRESRPPQPPGPTVSVCARSKGLLQQDSFNHIKR